jgi:CPA2 family monovalent cation:H+ antiporter-2
MHIEHEFLRNLALVLCVSAVTTILFQRLRQPVVLGYLLAGLIIGPHFPIPLVADQEMIRTISELGVILLMFYLGLEFSLRRLLRIGVTAGLITVIEVAIMLWLGSLAGRLLGWTDMESLFTGAILAISSTTIIAKVFEEAKVEARLREKVFAVLIGEDLIAVLILTLLTALSMGTTVTVQGISIAVVRLAGFLAILLVVGILVIPRLMRFVIRLHRPETTVIASIGICFAISLIALSFGYSVALGAFFAGILIAESGEQEHVEHLVRPVRDVFAAVFFVAVGMMIDPQLIMKYWHAVLVLTAVVVFGKLFGVGIGTFMTGHGIPMSIRAGLSLTQIGEFSFIIAALGLSMGVTGEFLYPVAVAVSGVTALTTPWLIRVSPAVAEFVDRLLPQRFQSFVALYGSWIEKLRTSPRRKTTGNRIRRQVLLQMLDASLLAGLIIGLSIFQSVLVREIATRTGVGAAMAAAFVFGVALAGAVPLCIGLTRVSRAMARTIATIALPSPSPSRIDAAHTPRDAFIMTLQIVNLLIVGVLLVAVTQPFLSPVQSTIVMSLLLVFLGIGFWRSTHQLEEHVRAGALALVEVLTKRGKDIKHEAPAQAMEPFHTLFPGMGDPLQLEILAGAACIGKTIAELNIRGRTGGIILAIRRGDAAIAVPSADERLLAGDVLAVAGSNEAVHAVRTLLLMSAQYTHIVAPADARD